MDGLQELMALMERELDGIKNNLVTGKYQDQRLYDQVLGEAKILNKMLEEGRRITSAFLQEEEVEDDD